MIKSRKGQVTIFIIIAVLIVAAVGIYFLVKGKTSSSGVPSEFSSVYDDFSFCLQNQLSSGIHILESKGGYIYSPEEFVAGSQYMPFSSELDFLGISVPYWYYVSGNNIQRENAPSKADMESSLAEFIEKNVGNCITTGLDDGTTVSVGHPSASVSIKSGEVVLTLNMEMIFEKGNTTSRVISHNINVDSDLGTLYDNAKVVYSYELSDMFLENYTLDVLNAYAPVDGVEISCSPKVWNAINIFNDLQTALEQNIAEIKVDGDQNNYFVLDGISKKISNNIYVNFLSSSNWPVTFEVDPSQGSMLIANPVGNEAGLGGLGFCYVAYHFVYDYKYPVMVQVHSEDTDEIFQFPVAVIIENSNSRKSLSGESSIEEVPQICDSANTEFYVTALDSSSRYVVADISFECFTQTCSIGSTEGSILDGLFPQCVNGYIIAKADGYKDAEVETSTVNSGSLTIYMDKLYGLRVNVELDSSYYDGEALVTFEDITDGKTKSILYPSEKSLNLSQGTYNISVSAFSNVSLELGNTTQTICTEVPRAITGVLGFTKKECTDVEIPDQLISTALSGGGTTTYTFSESDLENSNEIVLNADRFPDPDSLVQIQENYILFENKNVEVSLE